MAMSGEYGTVATKKPQVTVYVNPEVNEALDRAASEDQRSRSQMAAVLLEEALRSRGYLPPKSQDKSPEQQDKTTGQDS